MKKITKTIEVCETCKREDPYMTKEIECIICSQKGCDVCTVYTIVGSLCRKCWLHYKKYLNELQSELNDFRNEQRKICNKLIGLKIKEFIKKHKKK